MCLACPCFLKSFSRDLLARNNVTGRQWFCTCHYDDFDVHDSVINLSVHFVICLSTQNEVNYKYIKSRKKIRKYIWICSIFDVLHHDYVFAGSKKWWGVLLLLQHCVTKPEPRHLPNHSTGVADSFLTVIAMQPAYQRNFVHVVTRAALRSLHALLLLFAVY